MSTTRSTTLSASERERAQTILRAFLEGRCSLEQLINSLPNYIEVDLTQAPNSRTIRNLGLHGLAKIPVEQRHLRRMLERYLAGEISELDLSNWAGFLLGPFDFVPEGDSEEERAAAGGGPVWDILQRLSTPVIFGGLDRQLAERYLRMLD